MQRFRDVKQAIRVLAAFEDWVGPPAIVLGKDVVDGAIRMEAWKRLGFPREPPTRHARNRADAVRLLVLAGEAPKAERMLGGKWDDAGVAAAVFRLTKREATPLADPKRRYTIASRESARDALTRVFRAYVRALEDGRTSVPLTDLHDALRDAPVTLTEQGYSR